MNDIEEGRAGRTGQLRVLHVLRLLRSHRDDLEKIGIRHADIFGSVARGEDDMYVECAIAKAGGLLEWEIGRARSS